MVSKYESITASNETVSSSIDLQVAKVLKRDGIVTPPLEFEVVLIQHATPYDALQLAPFVHHADVIISEFVGYRPNDEDAINLYSQGLIGQNELFSRMSNGKHRREAGTTYRSFNNSLFGVFYKSMKSIAFADLPHNHPMEDMHNTHRKLGNLIGKILNGKYVNVAQASVECEKLILNYAAKFKQRNQFIAGNLPNAIARAIKRNPALYTGTHKSAIKVLIWMGSGHGSVAENIRARTSSAKIHNLDDSYLRAEPFARAVFRACEGHAISPIEFQRAVLAVVIDELLFKLAPVVRNRLLGKNFTKGEEDWDTLLTAIIDAHAGSIEEIYNRFREICVQYEIMDNRRNTALASFAAELIRSKIDIIRSRLTRST